MRSRRPWSASSLAADVVVGCAAVQLQVPSQLKAWIDRIAQPGRTFKYTEKGPQGLATGKTVIVVSTRGGMYSTSDMGRAMEHQESYLQTVFGFWASPTCALCVPKAWAWVRP